MKVKYEAWIWQPRSSTWHKIHRRNMSSFYFGWHMLVTEKKNCFTNLFFSSVKLIIEMLIQMLLWTTPKSVKKCTSEKPSKTCFSTRISRDHPIMSWSWPARKPSKRWRLPPPSPTTTPRRVRTLVRPPVCSVFT